MHAAFTAMHSLCRPLAIRTHLMAADFDSYLSIFVTLIMITSNVLSLYLTREKSVEPHRAVLNKKMSSPWGSPITSAKRWNVVRGTTIRRRQKSNWASRRNELYSWCQRYIPVSTTVCQLTKYTKSRTSCVLAYFDEGVSSMYIYKFSAENSMPRNEI